MAHHKRKKSKRVVRCTMCTQFRWYGNAKERQRPAVLRKLQEDRYDIAAR